MTTRTICRLALDLGRSPLCTTTMFALAALSLCSPILAQHRQAPPGMFKDLDEEILGQALVIHGKQLFIDDYVIEDLQGAKRVLNQPVKQAFFIITTGLL